MSRILRVSWYRLRATFSRRWARYLSLTLLIAWVGGLAMASISGARRTDSSFPEYWSTDPSNTRAFASFDNPGDKSGYNATVDAKIAHLPYVEHAAVEVGFDGNVSLNGVKE